MGDSPDPSTLSVLFLGKLDDPHCQKAFDYVCDKSPDVTPMFGSWDDPLPQQYADAVHAWSGDLIISYLSRWIVPDETVSAASLHAINFHPASLDYPGIGCNNFALYDNASTYGATCHHIYPKVDTGPIISTREFPTRPSDDVASLLSRTYDEMLEMYFEIVDIVFAGEPLPKADRAWTRQPYTRDDLNQLMTLTPTMSASEVKRRVRATSFGRWQPRMLLHGELFEHVPQDF